MASEAIKNIEANPDNKFFEGYCRGLFRLYYGETYGNEADHEVWLKTSDEFAEGYREGFAGKELT